MADGDTSLALRRARRAGAKVLDLSQRNLRTVPEDTFSIRTLQTLNLSENQLAEIPEAISQLSGLEELDLSRNKFADISSLRIDGLPNLRSVALEGNPVANQLGPTVVRQLLTPPIRPGWTSLQVIQGLLSPFSQVVSPPLPPGHPPNCAESPASNTTACFLSNNDADSLRRDNSAMVRELEQLRERVQELENSHASHEAGSSSKPSWLNDFKHSGLSSTLPSRKAGEAAVDEADGLRAQLKEEQRRVKRLEADVARLSDRLRERSGANGGVTGAGAGAMPHFDLSDVEIGEQISQGGFSIVNRGIWCGTEVAIKRLFDPSMSAENFAEFDNEVQKLEQLRHPNILTLLAVHRKPPQLSMLTELVDGGTLNDVIHSPLRFRCALGAISHPLPMPDALRILLSSAVAIAFMHARNMAHRDVKPHNVLLTPFLEVKLCDFGLARMFSELMTGTMQFAGTPNYMAPEIFENRKYTEKVDVFAFGTLMWETIALDIPFANLDPIDIKDKVLSGAMLAIPRETPAPLAELIQVCWSVDPAYRPPMVEVQRQLRHMLAAANSGALSASSTRPGPRRPQTATGAGRAARDEIGREGFDTMSSSLGGGGLGGSRRLGSGRP